MEAAGQVASSLGYPWALWRDSGRLTGSPSAQLDVEGALTLILRMLT